MNKVKAAFLNERPSWYQGDTLDFAYGHGRRQRLIEMTDMYPVVIDRKNFSAHVDRLADVEVVFSTWSMPLLAAEDVAALTGMKAIFYAGGSVKRFARAFMDQGVIVCSGLAGNAAAVAEFCLGQILLACKGYFRNTRQRHADPDMRHKPHTGRGTYGETIAIIGAGHIGRSLIELLRHFSLRVIVVDPYLSDDEAATLGVSKATLEEAFRQAYVVSNHLPDFPELRQVLNGELFASMRQDATFINTGRGAQVNEPEMISVLRKRPDLLALLDVTHPEPPPPDSELYNLPNVQISTHIAGAHSSEALRLGDMMVEEFLRWQRNEPLKFAVSPEMLQRMA